MQSLKGLYTALITPFDHKGNIDEEGFRNNIQYQLDNKVDGLVVLGTTGEAPTLSEEEKRLLIQTAKNEIKGKVPLIVGTGSYSTKQSVENTKLAQELGADAALIVTPYYNKPTQKGLINHFETLADAVSIPIILYNHPGRCGNALSLSTMRRLASIPNIIGIKEVTGSIDQISNIAESLIREFPDFSILSGDDPITFTLMANGGHGVISVAGNLVPNKMKALVDACLEGSYVQARKLHLDLLPLFRILCIETNPIPIKSAMNFCGLASGMCRLPLCNLEPENMQMVEQTLTEMKISPQKLAGVHG